MSDDKVDEFAAKLEASEDLQEKMKSLWGDFASERAKLFDTYLNGVVELGRESGVALEHGEASSLLEMAMGVDDATLAKGGGDEGLSDADLEGVTGGVKLGGSESRKQAAVKFRRFAMKPKAAPSIGQAKEMTAPSARFAQNGP